METLFEFVDIVGVPLQVVAADRTVLHTNARFNRTLGLAADTDWRESGVSLEGMEGLSAEGYQTALNRAVSTGKPQDCELLLDADIASNDPQNRNDTIPVRISPFARGGGQPVYVVLLCPYVSGAQRDEASLQRIQRGENLERLASGVAHEFNNLFTGIKGLTDLIKSEVDHSTEIYEFADSIEETVQRGSRLIQQLSSFARDEPYNLVETDITEYIQRSRPLLEIQLQRGTSLAIEVRAGGSVMLDAGRMDQALSNLLHNSRDALGGQGVVRITVDHQVPKSPGAGGQEDQWLMIEVADNGPGIAENLLSRVVEPFFTTKQRGKATGLGLSTTTKIVEMHSGLMRVGRSAELGGAAIRIHLPLVSAGA